MWWDTGINRLNSDILPINWNPIYDETFVIAFAFYIKSYLSKESE